MFNDDILCNVYTYCLHVFSFLGQGVKEQRNKKMSGDSKGYTSNTGVLWPKMGSPTHNQSLLKCVCVFAANQKCTSLLIGQSQRNPVTRYHAFIYISLTDINSSPSTTPNPPQSLSIMVSLRVLYLVPFCSSSTSSYLDNSSVKTNSSSAVMPMTHSSTNQQNVFLQPHTPNSAPASLTLQFGCKTIF